MVGLSEGQRRRLAWLHRACDAIWTQRPSARCYAYLRVRSSGRTRELILGDETLSVAGGALIDWQQAPLAQVFWAHESGDNYELELDDGRELEGEVVDLGVLETEPGEGRPRLRAIDDGDSRLVRVGPDEHGHSWRVEPSALVAPVALREPASRAQTSAAIEVVLDATQRRAVELDAERSLLILGEAGFGKTTVALHRLAHLRAQARAAERPFRALVLVPTRGLQRLVTALLDRLGAADVEVRSFAAWITSRGREVFTDLPARTSQDAALAVSRVKRHPALRAVLPEIVAKTAVMRELEAGYRDDERERPRDQLLHLFGDRAVLGRVAAASHGALGPRMIAEVLDHTKVQFSPTSEQTYAHVDADRLRTIDGLAIDAGTPLHDAGTLDVEDFAVLFELDDLRGGRKQRELGRYDHIVVDEAQEFAPIELAVIGRARAPEGSITVAGDEHQQVDETIVFSSWPAVVDELEIGDRCERIELEFSYRCPPAIERFARGLFDPSPAAIDDDPALAISAHAHELELVAVLVRTLDRIAREDPRASVAVVSRFVSAARRVHALVSEAIAARLVVDGDFRFGPGVSVTCVDEVKGLEFDYVIVPDANAASYPDTGEARRALYVAVTRAMSRTWLASTGRRSPLVPSA